MLGLVIIVLSFVIAVTGFMHTHADAEAKSTVLGITRTGALLIGCATGCLVAGAYQEYDKMTKSRHRDALLKSTHDEIIRVSQQMPDQDLEAKLTDIAASIDKLKSNDSSLAATLKVKTEQSRGAASIQSGLHRSTTQRAVLRRFKRPASRSFLDVMRNPIYGDYSSLIELSSWSHTSTREITARTLPSLKSKKGRQEVARYIRRLKDISRTFGQSHRRRAY